MSESNKVVAAILSTGRFINDFGVVRMDDRIAEYRKFLRALDEQDDRNALSEADIFASRIDISDRVFPEE